MDKTTKTKKQKKRSRCFLCAGPGTLLWTERGKEPRPVCQVCHFYRDNMTACQFRKKAKSIAEYQLCPAKRKQPKCTFDPKIFNKRRDSIRRSDIRHGCDPAQTMSQTALIKFVKEGGRCHYCGACPTGIDRQEWAQCYTEDNLQHFVPCCFQCNRMKRSKSMSAFVGHMEKVTCNCKGRVYECAELRAACRQGR